MPTPQSARVGKRGAIVVPAKLRKRFGIEAGSIIIAEETDDGILIRPAVVIPVERYSPECKAEFLISNATTEADYRKARSTVRKLGINPDSIDRRPFRWTFCFSTQTFSFLPPTDLTQNFLLSGDSRTRYCAVRVTLWRKHAST